MAVGDIVQAGTSLDAQWWIRAAQGAVRRFCGWHVAPSVSETLTLDGFGGQTLHLPSKHVTEVTKVLSDGVDVTDQVDWSSAGMMELRSGMWSSRLGGISVDLTHGFELDEVPEIAALILTVGKRARTQPGVASQSVNGAAMSAFSAGGAPLGVPLLSIERETLAPYKLGWGPS